MKTITLNALEVRALQSLLWNSIGCCSGGCVFDEMTTKKTDCDKCPFTKAVDSINEKLG